MTLQLRNAPKDYNEYLKDLQQIFNPVPFKTVFLRINSWDDTIQMTQALTGVSRIEIKYLFYRTIQVDQCYMKIRMKGFGYGWDVDVQNGIVGDYFKIVPLSATTQTEIYFDNLGYSSEYEAKNSISKFDFEIYINKSTDTVDQRGTDISSLNPLLIELAFYH